MEKVDCVGDKERLMKYVFSCCLVMIVFCNTLNATPLTIVEDGERHAAIIVAIGEPQAKQAAQEIQKYIEKMSGAKLDIIEEGVEPTQQIRIYVGRTQRATERGVDIPSGFDPSVRDDVFEGEEGYILKTMLSDIFIAGNQDGPYRGTLHGAYGFLEKLGCRFYFPGDWGEVVPRKKTITVPDLDTESRPDFPIRFISGPGSWPVPATAEEMVIYEHWCEKIGFQRSGVWDLYPLVGDGFLGILLPPGDFFEAHPEWYAMDKRGARHVPTEGDVNHATMLCLSNPEGYEQVLKNLKTAFAEKHYESGPNVHRISYNGLGISPPDGSPYCYCQSCKAASQNFEYPPYVYGPQMSEEYYAFAARLAAEFPDKYVATMAYSLREMPPQGVEFQPNMTVHYAPISCCALHSNADPHCWRRQEYVKMLGQYCKKTPHVYLYEYRPSMLTGNFVPEPGTANMAVNIPIYKALGVKGLSAEGRKAFMQTWLTYYVTAKLLWDAKTDVDALKRDFYDTFFGPEAGPFVQAWWDDCEAQLARATVHVHEDFLINHVYDVEFTKRIHRHVEKGRKASMTDEQRERFEAFALIADHLEAWAEMEEAEKHLDFDAAIAAADRMLEDERKLDGVHSFLITPRAFDPPQPFYPEGRKARFEELRDKTNGEKGEWVAALPLEMRFTRDRFNEGVIHEYYEPDFDDSQWGTKNTFYTWDAQDPPEDSLGHDYDGYGWYRGTFSVPKEFKDKPVSFYAGGVINEGWIWINGKYAHHTNHKVWWWHPHGLDIEISDFVEPGKVNTIAIRVYNKAEVGGFFRRGFFWSPLEEVGDKQASVDR